MDLKLLYMTLEGNIDKNIFIEQWSESSGMDATFLQTEDTVFMMPYGKHTHLSLEEKKTKFAGTHRRHTFLIRDFEITDKVIGGGYLNISSDMKSCSYVKSSHDFGSVPDSDVVVNLVNKKLFDNE